MEEADEKLVKYFAKGGESIEKKAIFVIEKKSKIPIFENADYKKLALDKKSNINAAREKRS